MGVTKAEQHQKYRAIANFNFLISTKPQLRVNSVLSHKLSLFWAFLSRAGYLHSAFTGMFLELVSLWCYTRDGGSSSGTATGICSGDIGTGSSAAGASGVGD